MYRAILVVTSVYMFVSLFDVIPHFQGVRNKYLYTCYIWKSNWYSNVKKFLRWKIRRIPAANCKKKTRACLRAFRKSWTKILIIPFWTVNNSITNILFWQANLWVCTFELAWTQHSIAFHYLHFIKTTWAVPHVIADIPPWYAIEARTFEILRRTRNRYNYVSV